MWSRTTNDPLGKLLFAKYGVHVLPRPREHVEVIDVLAVRDGKTSFSGSIDSFLRAPFQRPAVLQDEALIDVEAIQSAAVSGSVALDFLKGFLAWMGGGGNSVSAAVEASKSNTLRFKFGGCKRDHVKDAFDLDWKLSEVAFDKNKSAMRDDYRYYIVTAVHTCTDLTFEVLDKNLAKIDMSASVDAAGGAKANFSISKDGQVTAKSQQKLAYGVELNEIAYDEKRKQLQLRESQNFVQTAAVQQVLPRAQIGGPAATMLLTVAD